MPGDRLVCLFIKSRQCNERFTEWPLHVTIVPWFRTPLTTGTIAQTLTERLKHQMPFQVTLDGKAHFGRRGQKLVHLVQEPTPLTEIEVKVRTYLHEQKAWIVDETTMDRRPFRPHVTNQSNAAVHDGQTFAVNTLYVVERLYSQKEVVGAVELST